MLNKTLAKLTLAGVVLVTVAALTSSHAQAQSQTLRRGGPRDWSSSHLIASSFGPDMGAKINRDREVGRIADATDHVPARSPDLSEAVFEIQSPSRTLSAWIPTTVNCNSNLSAIVLADFQRQGLGSASR